MKYCPHEALRYPDDVSTCLSCGRTLVDVSSIDELPDQLVANLATSCCPNPACKTIVAPSQSNFCAACGNRLEPISYEVWVNKIVEPAFDNQIAATLLHHSGLFRPIIEMGLSRAQALKLLDSYVERRTGAPLDVLTDWTEHASLLLNDEDNEREACLHFLLEKAAELGIDSSTATTIIAQLTNSDVTETSASIASPLPDDDATLEGDEDAPPFLPDQTTAGTQRAPFPTGRLVVVTLPLLAAILVVLWNAGKSEPTIPEPAPIPTPVIPISKMVLIKGATFMMGNDGGDKYERPRHAVTVASFYMDLHEVTNEEYAEFVKATNQSAPRAWSGNVPPSGSANFPVTGVNWHEANAYARWAKKRLPTEAEWELAARTQNSWRYPWGNEWRPNAANAATSRAKGLVEVGSYPAGNNPQGVSDLIGNAWEWTADNLEAYPGGELSDPPAVAVKVIRGGSWQENMKQATGSYRGYMRSVGASDYSATGFRCVRDAGPEQSKTR
jgi:formylglycine-generating enzyme